MTWSAAMTDALYGPSGFYRCHKPDAHYRTSVNASPLFARSLVPLAMAVDGAIGHPARFDVVDVGAGDGQLLAELLAALPGEIAARVHATAVDIRPRPIHLPDSIDWSSTMPPEVAGLVIANEYLDNIPCDVAECRDDTMREVMVDPSTGSETLGASASSDTATWCDAWWPPADDNDRAEIGLHRDAAWSEVITHLTSGLAVAVDYGHTREERDTGAFSVGTLTGYRDGHQVVPVPDGSCDITAHVAMDACQHAGVEAGATASALLRQAEALRALGLDTRRPPIDLAHTDPPAYVEGLSHASHAAELLDPASLGSFWWLLQAKSCQPAIEGITWS